MDADREAASALGVETDAVVTADTNQDGRRVRSVTPRDPVRWLAEARAVIARGRTRVVKTGLLPDTRAVRAVAELAGEFDLTFVVDPVLAASGGEPFLDEAGVAALLEELLPRGPVLTPNLPEAARLTGADPERLAGAGCADGARLAAAAELLERGARACLLKGGHGCEDPVRDLILERGAEPLWHVHPRIHGGGIHGSGCRYASSVAAALVRGATLAEAARRAGEALAARMARGMG